jgi:hypothetical protein
MSEEPSREAEIMAENRSVATLELLNPVVVIALLILFSVFVLIGAAIFGIDNGVLLGMAKAEFARGLITYLFAVVTIGTAVVLVVSALTTAATEENERKFQRGKEIMSLLLGVFGTIVGFYFGAEIKGTPAGEMANLSVTPILLSQDSVAGGEAVTITAAVSGGRPPYQYGIALGETSDIKYEQSVGKNGWIVTKISTPIVQNARVVTVKLGVRDTTGTTFVTSAGLALAPKSSGP